jgi:hypothetical protein
LLTSFDNFFNSKLSAEKSSIVTSSPLFSRILAIYNNPKGGAIPLNNISFSFSSMLDNLILGYISKKLISSLPSN